MMFIPGNAGLTSWKTGSDLTLKDFRGHAVHRNKSYSILVNSALSSAWLIKEEMEIRAQEKV